MTIDYYVVANKLQAKYQKPAAVLTYSKLVNDKEPFYRGSMRNYGLSSVKNLKEQLIKTGKIEMCQGHSEAAGLSIAEANIEDFIEQFNKQYADIDQTPVYWVDYIWKPWELYDYYEDILDMGALNIYGQEIPESFIGLKDIELSAYPINLMGVDKGHPTIKITINGIEVMKFKSSEEEYELFTQPNTVMDCVCKCSINKYNGNESPQLIIQNYELREDWIF